MTMLDMERIQEHMPVVGSDGAPVGTVDALEGNAIKMTRGETGGPHHWVPTTWVRGVDNEGVHLDRPAREAQQSWIEHPPTEGEVMGSHQ